ncbi:MAG: hypothetical protein KF886_14320 [Candidatus Hydrogenedentes bacterium]|nr:hypothetical protein [Candidatus Hydrogenedentota bacterium]
MFSQAFYKNVDQTIAAISGADEVSRAAFGRCLAGLARCLEDAEVDDRAARAFLDGAIDHFAADPAMPGACLGRALRELLRDIPGLDGRASDFDGIPTGSRAAGSRWDMKELDNRIAGPNRASLDRLRRLLGVASERRLTGAVDLRRRRCFEASCGMKMGDRHDAGIDGEQINRLIQYLGHGRGGFGPNGGRPAVLG